MFPWAFRPTRYHTALVPAVLTFALLSGCAGKRAGVQGTVTFDDQPVDGGLISFFPEGDPPGRPNVQAPIEKGKYSLSAAKGPELGKHRVEIVWHRKTGKQVPTPGDPGFFNEETQQVIPAAYNGPKTTLSADVQRGTNTFDFALKKQP